MSRDMLLYGGSNTERDAVLKQWVSTMPELHQFVPDFHRLQIEHWVWSHRADLRGRVLDIGVDDARRWLGSHYRTLGVNGSSDLRGDLRRLPVASDSLDGLVCTEVLEHCEDPGLAVSEIYRVLKPGGLLLVTSPFFWPQHATRHYRDYWRFTDQGWALLLRPFREVEITPCDWTDEGAQFYEMMRRFECMGNAEHVKATTGYLCTARK